MKKALILCAAALACGCPPEDMVACPTFATSGLSVGVTNQATGQPVCDATVTAAEGSYSETLLANGCRSIGAWERPGNYEVHAAAPGLAARTIKDVRVEMGTGQCPHIVETRLDVALVPSR